MSALAWCLPKAGMGLKLSEVIKDLTLARIGVFPATNVVVRAISKRFNTI